MLPSTQTAVVALSTVGLEISRLLNDVNSLDRQVGDTKHREWPRALFAAESDRFELWAINMGLFVPGHGSLDYRIRDARMLKGTLARFMTDLRDSLAQVLQYCNGSFNVNVSLESNADSDDPDDFNDDWMAPVLGQPPADDDSTYALVGDTDSDIDLLLDSVRDPIDRLYKLSTRIRNPGTRFASSKAQRYQKINHESGCDFLDAVKPFDRDYISSMFLQYHKSNALRDAPVVEPAFSTSDPNPGSGVSNDVVWEPIRSVLSIYRTCIQNETESFLVDRLARANTRRRRQFAYWTHHREKLFSHARVFSQEAQVPSTAVMMALGNVGSQAPERSNQVLQPSASVTTATQLQVAHMQLGIRDDQSTVSFSEYAPSAHSGVGAVDFPPPPKRKGEEKYFECPYCFTLCPAGSLGQKAWRAHLIRDLRPYVCTYEVCRNPDQLYDSRDDWIQHENSSHRATWQCPEHVDLSFSNVEVYRTHLSAFHSAGNDTQPPPGIIKASESSPMVSDRCCPICNFSPDAASELHKHIALHLERIALFSLPHVGGDDDDDGNDAGSQSVNLADDGSQDEESTGSSVAAFDDDDPLQDDQNHQLKSAAGIARQRWRFILDTVCRTKLGFERADRLRAARSFQSPLRTMHNEAVALAAQGRLREAEDLYSRILQVRRRALGQHHHRTLTSMAELAAIYEQEGLTRRSEELLAEVTHARLLLAPNPLVGAANLALPYRNQGLPGETEALERRLMTAAELDRQRKEQEQTQSFGQVQIPTPTLGDFQAKLLQAVKTGNKEVVQLLLSVEGVDPDGRDSNDRTPLSWAAGFGDTALVRLFLATPAVDPDFADCRGQTPLSWAADCGHTDVVALLLNDARVDPDSRDASGWTPLAWAASKGYEAVVQLLLTREDVDANSVSESGLTPLAWAVVNGYQQVVKAFLFSGRANLNYDGFGGKTLLGYALKSGNEVITEMIEDAVSHWEAKS